MCCFVEFFKTDAAEGVPWGKISFSLRYTSLSLFCSNVLDAIVANLQLMKTAENALMLL